MARREHQGLQISLILLVMVTIVLAITTFLFFRTADEMTKRADKADEAVKAATSARDKAIFKAQRLENLIGATDEPLTEQELAALQQGTDDEALTAIVEKFRGQMAQLGDSIPEQTYSKALAFLLPKIADKGVQIADASIRETGLIKERQDTETRETGETKIAQEAAAKATADLVAQRDAFTKAREQLNTEKQTLFTDLQTKQKEYSDLDTRTKKQITDLDQQLGKLQVTNARLIEKIRQGELVDIFETPDGNIIWVNQASRRVGISLGRADGLREQMTFSVYNREDTGVTGATPKARIEVSKVSEYASEARIVDDNVKDLILKGDVFHTPSWSPGRHLHFGIAGIVDVNQDGKSDNELVKQLIKINGGVVDYEVAPNGDVTPDMAGFSVETRYLIRGAADTSSPAGLAAYAKALEESRLYGIQEIKIEQFIALMGWRSREKTVTLGRGALSSDFAPEAKNTFRARRPPGRGKNGSF